MEKMARILTAGEKKQSLTGEKTAKKRARIWMVSVGIVWLLLYYIILIKVPFYVCMNQIHVPENCTDLETNVIITDLAYGWHIEAERLIYSSQGEEGIENYINENNKFSKRIMISNFYESNSSESDGFSILIPSEKYPCQEQEEEHYISLRYNTAHSIGNFYNVAFNLAFVFGIMFMLVLCWITYRINLHRHKNNALNDSQTLPDGGGL